MVNTSFPGFDNSAHFNHHKFYQHALGGASFDSVMTFEPISVKVLKSFMTVYPKSVALLGIFLASE